MNFIDILKKKRIYFDGATGTQIQNLPIDIPSIPEILNITHPDLMTAIHKNYVDAGSDIVTTNTFGANNYKLSKCDYTVNQLIDSAVKNAKKSGSEFVALGLGPIGTLIGSIGELSFDNAYDLFCEQITAGVNAGCDLVLIETMTDIYEAKAAILAAKERSDLPIICSMTFEQNGRTLTGTDPLTMVNILESLNIDAIGINCSFGPNEMLPLVEDICKYSSLPVLVQPNAGLPKVLNGKTFYDTTSNQFAKYMEKIALAGASILGGCCGTAPEYIEKLIYGTKDIPLKKSSNNSYTAVSSSNKTIIIGETPIVIGERINPTGKKKLKEALRNNDIQYIKNLALSQYKEGAQILDVNVGLPELDEITVLSKCVKEIQQVVNLPLQIDSSNVKAIEKALRIYNGKALINSVNGNDESMNAIFPLAKKYGACVLGLTMDDKGIPSKAEDRVKIAERIIIKAGKYGIDKKNILIDCLTLTASAQQKEVYETINAVKMIKDKFGVKTILGVSNVSFGLPNRNLLNRTFLTLALSAGLDAPILNPANTDMMDTIKAYNLLSSKDQDGLDYINHYSSIKAESELISNKKESKVESNLHQIIIDGQKEKAANAALKLLETMDGLDIVNKYIIPALDEVGEKYETGEIFLPQLIYAANTVQEAFKTIKGSMDSNDEKNLSKGKILLASVKGDVHDIGKNIVKVILENYGYDIIDLGKDVPANSILETAIKEKVHLIGLSALMTTTVTNMEKTIELLKSNIPDCKIMVGGAVLNKEYAKMINADYYAKDAKGAADIAKNYFLNKDFGGI